MPTIMILLRLAPNLERRWIALQDTLFFRCGLISTRLFPPVIPVATVPARVRETLPRILEKIRKSYPLELHPGSNGPDGDHEPCYPADGPIRYVVSLYGFTSLRDAVTARLGPSVTKSEEPAIVLAWDHRESLQSERKSCTEGVLLEARTPEIPVTRAFWLTAVELEAGPDPRAWWESAVWRELYSRRTTVRDQAPEKL
jgi:hypothetical protein